MASHMIDGLNVSMVRCICGWIYRLESPSLWGSRSAQDALLDQYNAHKRRPAKLNKPGPDRDEE